MENIKVKQEQADKTGSNTVIFTSSPKSSKKKDRKEKQHSSTTKIKKVIPKTPFMIKKEPNIEAPKINRVQEKKPKSSQSSSQHGSNKLSEFFVDLPEIKAKDKQNDNDDLNSSISSHFTLGRINTAGTNATNITRATTAGSKGKLKLSEDEVGIINHHNYIAFLDEHIDDENIGDLKIKERIRKEEMNFSSSPCVTRKRKQDELSLHEGQNFKKHELQIFSRSVPHHKFERQTSEGEENIHSTRATIDNTRDDTTRSISVEATSSKRPIIPDKYQINNNPVYDNIPGEDDVYYEIMGKTDKAQPLDSNEQQFLKFVNLGFDDWTKKSMEFTKEYDILMKKVMVARMKFDRRFQFLLQNLNNFALKLEKHGDEMNKRSEILKEYCSKIVSEIE